MSANANGNSTGGGGAAAADRASTLVVGLSIPQSQVNAAALLKAAREDEYDFVTTALPHSLEGRDDVRTLDSKWWRTSVVGVCPELRDWSVTMERLPKQVQWGLHMSLPAIILPAPPAAENDFMDYARAVQSLCMEASQASVQLWIKVALTDLALLQFDLLTRLCDAPGCLGMILWAEPLAMGTTSASSYSNTAGATVAAQMSLLHKAIGSQLKALCFPTKVFLTNKRGYPTLAKINQVLFTEALRRIGRTLRVVVEGPSVHDIPDGAGAGGTFCLPYLQYIHHIRQRQECIQALDSSVAQQEFPYLDSLQRPLQPLADHLEFQMYETFEKDPVKYVQYRSAMLRAIDTVLQSRKRQRQQQQDAMMTSSTTTNDQQQQQQQPIDNHVVVFVAGAGRGPLVTATLEAFEFVSKQFRQQNASIFDAMVLEDSNSNDNKLLIPSLSVYAIEKNPSAIIYLNSKVHHEWKEYNVKIVHQDVRVVTPRLVQGHKADVVISELLGSFGDNELSPECLQVLLASSDVCKPTTLSVPMRYTSHLAPISSLRLYSEAKHQAQLPAIISMGGGGSNGNSTTTNQVSGQSVGPLAAMETPYVVRSHSAAQTHVEMDCWNFSHDGMASNNKGLTRTAHLEFVPDITHAAACGGGSVPADAAVAQLTAANTSTIPTPVTIHGFLGTFTADLFDENHPSVQNLMGTTANAGGTTNPPTQISTAPANFSKDMCSWFPLYFPLREPMNVPAGATLGVSLWRRTDSDMGYTQPAPPATATTPAQHRVWYEWCAKTHRGGEVLNVTPIHNPNGRSYHVSM
ncbi:arginine N-methyltransferase 5 [Seminavis robusta]|uniref:Protein arginine N-methyltransferase n=1 Tax=Seminavis robusta TaxID=568900 RepID=A0A9N8EH29_9STRA|nr:arginine N-methyltransferase 5 [Seminavis robusta]|eukprot:Sro926_g220980.1 arginine N-methyltransferase 5 (802) ;mRNA; r:7562-10199